MKSGLALLLCIGCSGQLTDEGVRTQRQPLEALTVCSADQSLDAYLQWSADYWWEQGLHVDWVSGPDCAVPVRIAHESGRKTRHCYDGNPATDGWCNGEVAIYDKSRSSITLRLEPCERFDEAWRAHTLTHELGHLLGVPHSATSPMWTCEVEAWCFGDTEVQEWFGGL
jgi:hypothetical protein